MWPEWWDWELVFTGHAELRMVAALATHHGQPWIVIVEPDFNERALVIVTGYERGR